MIRALNLEMNFHVDQRRSPGEISLQNGQGRFLTPEGNAESPIDIEVVSMNPFEITATETVNGVPQEAAWIDLPGTDNITGDGFFYYQHDLVVETFEYGEDLDGTTDRTAIINIYIPATGTSVNYSVTQQAPYVRIDRETVSAPRPIGGSGTETILVFVYTNVQSGDLSVAKEAGGSDDIRLLAGGELTQYDPRNPGNLRFEVGVVYDPDQENSYGANFIVSDIGSKYGELPDESIRVVVPPKNQTFDSFWYNASFGTDPAFDWLPAPMTKIFSGSNYVFPWNTTSVSFDVISNVGHMTDPTHMAQADIDRMSVETSDYDGSGTILRVLK